MYSLALWHINALPGNSSINTPRYAQTTIGRILYLVARQQSASQWTCKIVIMWLVFCVACAMQYYNCVFCAWSVPRGYERIREWELTWLEFRNSKRTAVWPEEESKYLVCDVTNAIVIVILRVYELIVVTNSEDPINRFTNRDPCLSHWNMWLYYQTL
jgi:hypothetical protein